MGRYYSGDIEGKFWFAVQSSNAADRFGSIGHNNYLEYYFDSGNLPDIKKGIKEIEENLGENLKLLDEFFKINNGYNEQMIKDFFKEKGKQIGDGDIKYVLEEYADLGLGKKILKCVEDNEECAFTAEL
jgi:hypothetical protein